MKRKKYVDLLREIALFHMIFQHSVLGLLSHSDNVGIFRFFYEIIPICPALFLFLSGFSITIKGENTISNEKFNQNFFKGIVLILSAALLFFIEHGHQFPDLYFASGILNTIGISLIICSVLVMLPNKIIFSFLLILYLFILYFLLYQFQIQSFPLDTGYEPLLPTLIFGLIGFLFGLINNRMNQKHEKILWFSIGVIGFTILVIFFILYGPFKIFYSNIGRYTIERLFNESNRPEYLFQFNEMNAAFYKAYIWNYKPTCFIATLGGVLFLFSIAYFSEPLFVHFFPEKIFLPGRKALLNYFFHLAVIAVLVVIFGFNRFNTFWFTIYLILIYFSIYLINYLILIFFPNKKKKPI
ncbi:MAG: DUF1624 domain-containing protein [Spirochaetes bacterium]|nr:DUF1624 domain-containing protein [Spirochaetota bacterium]